MTSAGYTLSFDTAAQGLSAVKRTLGCLILTALPETGVDEALQSLQDIWVYHSQYAPAPALPLHTPPQVGSAFVARQTERPPLSLSDD